MKLENVLKNPTTSLLYCEWNVNFLKYFTNPLKDDLNHDPANKEQEVKVFLLKDNISILGLNGFQRPRYFVVNNYEKGLIPEDSPAIEVLAFKSGSPRTFFIPSLDAYVKTHFSGRISSNYRQLFPENIKASLATCEEIMSEIGSNVGVSILPEYGGVIWDDIGCIYRSTTLYPSFEGSMIPLYSLCGTDVNSKEEIPLFVQIANEKSMDPEDFMVYEIIKPLMHSWNWFTSEMQRKISCHGQNVLIGVESGLNNFRIIHRDLQTKKYDLTGINLEESEVIELTRNYDFYVGCLLFDQIKDNNQKYINSESFVFKIKEIFNTFAIKDLLHPNRVYDQGLGEAKRRIVLDKEPKYR